MKMFCVGVLLFLSGCGSGGSPIVPSYTDSDRSRDVQTNGLVWWILLFVSLLVVKVMWDQFRNIGSDSKEQDPCEKPPVQNPPVQNPPETKPEEPGEPEEMDDHP